MNIKLSVAIGDGEIPVYDFESIDQLTYFIENILTKGRNAVWLFGEDISPKPIEEILITERLTAISRWISNNINFGDMDNEPTYHYFIHSYESYESAYAVALNIREDNPLCYDDPKNNNSPIFKSISDFNTQINFRQN